MNEEKYNRSVELQCETCGGSKFEFEEPITDASLLKCVGCDREYIKSELMELNEANIQNGIEEMGQDFMKDVTKDLKKSFGKAFK